MDNTCTHTKESIVRMIRMDMFGEGFEDNATFSENHMNHGESEVR